MTAPSAEPVLARVTDFSTEHEVWTRRLWDAGAILALREVLDACQWVEQGALRQSAVDWQRHDLQRQLGPDAGLGDARLRREINRLLSLPLKAPSHAWRQLTDLTETAAAGYLGRHATAVKANTAAGTEKIARYLTSHLLDSGFSMPGVRTWAASHRRNRTPLIDVINDAERWVAEPEIDVEVLVPFFRVPDQQRSAAHLSAYRSRRQTFEWLHVNGYKPSVPFNAAFAFQVRVRDLDGAPEVARSLAESLLARATFASNGTGLQPEGNLYVAGLSKPEPIVRTSRQARILSLESERQLYTPSSAGRGRLDAALELAASLNHGPIAPAVWGTWSALESLLFSAADDPEPEESGRVIVAKRAAALVACSWPRAELTALSYRLGGANTDQDLLKRMSSATTNRDRAGLVSKALADGSTLDIENGHRFHSDTEAMSRMRRLHNNPHQTLSEVVQIFERSLRRLYRSRNVIAHAGATDALAHNTNLRIGAPLVGAALDRISHAYLVQKIDPLVLSSRAMNSLCLASDVDGRSLTDLLE